LTRPITVGPSRIPEMTSAITDGCFIFGQRWVSKVSWKRKVDQIHDAIV
jgi:hypothetical protein